MLQHYKPIQVTNIDTHTINIVTLGIYLILIFLYPVLSCHHELFTGTMKHFLLIEFCDRIQCCGLGGVWVWVWGMGMMDKGYGILSSDVYW